MSERRKVSSDVSAALVDYILREKGITQEELAKALEVSAGFISRVRAKERSFTVDSLVLLEEWLGIPLGALLLAAIPIPEPRPELKKLYELAKSAILQGDITAAAIRSAESRAVAK